jgi:Trk K+ transport system NAD-binding subunit
MRGGTAEIAVGETVIRPGDQVVAILKPGLEDAVRRALAG